MIKKTLVKGPQSYKVHVRRLPPLLKEEEFYATIEEFLKEIILKQFVQGKLKEQEKIDSRCYLYFNNEQSMQKFIQGYNKVFCDEKGNYYRPDIGKALLQNQQDLLKNKPNPLEGTYEKTELYKKFLKAQEEEKQLQEEKDQTISPTKQDEQQQIVEEKKKFEKIKTNLILGLEKEYNKKIELKSKIENMSNSNIIKLKCEEDGKTVERTFIFVPKARN